MTPPRYWRSKARIRLEGSKCPRCGKEYYPPVNYCPSCKEKTIRIKLPREGKIITWTKIHQIGRGHELKAPIYIALIELKNGVRLISRLTDLVGEPKEGMEVEAVLRREMEDGEDGLILYAIAFRPKI